MLDFNKDTKDFNKNFNKDTAVILAQAVNSSQAIFYICFILTLLSLQITSIFGPTKVRVLRGSYSWVGVMRIILYYFAVLSFLLLTVFLWKVATKMDLVFLPSTGELRMWWVMST